MGREGVVDKAGGKAHALALTLFADGIVDIGAVQRIQRGGQALHIRAADGTPPQHSGQQRVGRRCLSLQRCDQLHGHAAGFEALCGQIRQKHVLHDLPSIIKHSQYLRCKYSISI